MTLIASLIVDKTASDTLCWEMKKNNSVSLFELLLQCLESSDEELKTAALLLLTQLSQSISHKERSKRDSYVEFIDNLKLPLNETPNNKLSAGDRTHNDCQPEYIVEDLCRILIELYKELSSSKKYLESEEEAWCSVSACISSLLALSPRCRLYAVHRHFPQILLNTLQAVRDKLSLHGKPADVIRNANHEPILRNLYWILTIINTTMLDCLPAKESFADENIAVSLNKLWPWCMMTEQLREALVKLLLTFTNECPKAWSCMCVCVSGRSMALEVCAIVTRDASRLTTGPLLPLALRLLTNCASHQHCRAIILKSEVVMCVSRLRARSNPATLAYSAWMRLAERLARHADGAAALLAAVSSPGLRPVPRRLLPAIAHAAHYHRSTFLQSPDILELLCGSLLTGETGEVVCAARAVWALAANNHRAKLVLRSAGVTAAVHSTLHRLQKSKDPSVHKALELLTYTHNILQTT
ncbi:uncharacterized protein LOC126976567 [Leptidea sinapis]|uniref:uncharacterized protein LOC126976567 n=1 Tax=Leptidea sinapis TaxID=189913 RepID=UPI0021C3F56C|nr:uncharacterized protein LOC126976567 [Leptidea sinapis]